MSYKIGYARVSTKEQNLARQIKELEENGCNVIYKDKQSGRDFGRKEYQKMKIKLRPGDIVVVHDLTRFGRNKNEIKNEWKAIIDEGADIEVLNMPILNTAQFKDLPGVGQLVSELVHTVLSWVVEDELRRSKEAQREGIAIAKAEGKYKGRPKKYHAEAKGKDKVIYEDIVSRLNKGFSVMDIHRELGISRSSIYRIREQIAIEDEEQFKGN